MQHYLKTRIHIAIIRTTAALCGFAACVIGRYDEAVLQRHLREGHHPELEASIAAHPGEDWHLVGVPGRPVDGDVLTPKEEHELAVARYMLERQPPAADPVRIPRARRGA